MKKNGFTLIELLAVIIILAIIALIAVPVVINIINDSKNSSEEQSVELYIDAVEKAISRKQLSNPSFNPDKCEIKYNGNLLCDDVEVSIDMKGILPNDGDVIIKNNKIKLYNIMLKGSIYYPKYAILIDDADNNNEISKGDKYTYKVNDEYTFYFYILSFNEDDTVNLIMDRNICENGTVDYKNNYCNCSWYKYSSNNYNGPVTAMNVLYNATKEWDNVPNMNLNYSDEGHLKDSRYGYGKIETTPSGIKMTMKDGTEVTSENNSTPVIPYIDGKMLKARLPEYNEIYNVDSNHCSGAGGCPAWLVNNLQSYYDYYIENDHVPSTSGYWTMSSAATCEGFVDIVVSVGNLNNTNTSNSVYFGVRPVITVPMSDLSN